MSTFHISGVNGIADLMVQIDGPGVYVARGPNGAGKSSAIEAIRAASGDPTSTCRMSKITTNGQMRLIESNAAAFGTLAELIVDNFAGGGGASSGIETALGRSPDIAINHCDQALAMHVANHPDTHHVREDVFDVDPVKITQGRKVGLAWFSPDCTHFSKAKGAKPRSKNIRGLAWVMVKWAATVRPRVCILENVEEFKTWGPLLDDGSPCPLRKGRTFKSFVKRLMNLGYAVEWRELRACDFGAPTIRKRLILIARCDGLPIAWPKQTHGHPDSEGVLTGKLRPWRTAAECINWQLPCPSVFLTKEEGRAIGVNRPLAEASLRRIARGLKKFVFDCQEPFIVPLTHQGGDRVESVTEPARTITGAHRGERALLTPYLTEFANASTPRVFAANEALRTQCAQVKGGHFALIAPHLTKYYGERRESENGRASEMGEPLHTQPTENRFALVTAFLAKHFGGNYSGNGVAIDSPTSTITTRDHHAVVQSSFVAKLYGTTTGSPAGEPAHTITGQGNHLAEVRAFLVKYYGNEVTSNAPCNVPMHTVTSKDRMGLVTVRGEDYLLADIGMRMLNPRELFTAQGFEREYVIAPVWHGKPLTKEAQVRMCGNSVPPPLACAIVAANVPELRVEKKAA